MRTLTTAEYDMLADVAHDERFICETDATVTADDLGPDVDGPTVDSLEQRGAIERIVCAPCSAAAGDEVDHSRLTPLGRLALRLANAARLEVA